MDVKIEFVSRLKAGERMSDLCLEYGIHRQTGYEVWQRYKDGGPEGLLPRVRTPKHIPHRTPQSVVDLLVRARKKQPTWGPKKLKAVLEKKYGTKLPAQSTIGEVLKRAGLIEPNRRRQLETPRRTGLTEALAPNDLWCADYKGQFRLGNRSYCYPLTLTDQYSRFILACEGMEAISDEAACEATIETFRTYGIPRALRFWMRLKIRLERIEPGHRRQASQAPQPSRCERSAVPNKTGGMNECTGL